MCREAEASYLEAFDILSGLIPSDHPHLLAIRSNLERCHARMS